MSAASNRSLLDCDLMALLPAQPKAYSKAARSPRQSTVHGAAPRTARPATSGPQGVAHSPRSESSRGSVFGQSVLLKAADRFPAVTLDDALHAEGGRFAQAALVQHRMRFQRDGAHNGGDELGSEAATPRRSSPPSGEQAPAPAAVMEDVHERHRGLTSSPRLPDDTLLRTIIRDHLDSKSARFRQVVAIDATPVAAGQHHGEPRGRKSPEPIPLADLCLTLAEEIRISKASAQAGEGFAAASAGSPNRASNDPVLMAYTATTALRRSPFDVGANSPHSHANGGGDEPGSPLQVEGLDQAEAALLREQALEKIKAKAAHRREMSARSRAKRYDRALCTLASTAPRFAEPVDDVPPVGQYTAKYNGVHPSPRSALLAAKPKTRTASPSSQHDVASAPAALADMGTPVRQAVAAAAAGSAHGSPAAVASPGGGGGLTTPRGTGGATNLQGDSPRARAKLAADAAALQPKPPKASWAFASAGPQVASTARVSACRDVVYGIANDTTLSHLPSPRLIDMHTGTGRDTKPITRDGSAAKGAEATAMPTHRNTIAERCRVPSHHAGGREHDAIDRAIETGGFIAAFGSAPTGFVDMRRFAGREEIVGGRFAAPLPGPDMRSTIGTLTDNITVADLDRPPALGFVDFPRQTERPPLHQIILYSSNEHAPVLAPPQPRHLRDVDFGRMGPFKPVDNSSYCAAEGYDASHDLLWHRQRGATLGVAQSSRGIQQTSPARAARADEAFVERYGVSRPTPAAGYRPSTNYATKVTEQSDDYPDLKHCLDATRAGAAITRAHDFSTDLPHHTAVALMTDARAIDVDKVAAATITHPRVQGDPHIAKALSREGRNAVLEVKPIRPLSDEAATVLLGVRRWSAVQTDMKEAGHRDRLTRYAEPVLDGHCPVRMDATESRASPPRGRLAVSLAKSMDVPGPGYYNAPSSDFPVPKPPRRRRAVSPTAEAKGDAAMNSVDY